MPLHWYLFTSTWLLKDYYLWNSTNSWCFYVFENALSWKKISFNKSIRMKLQTPTFATTIKLFEYRYDLRSVFNDFLTMALCAFSQNPDTGKSYDEDLYLETVA